MPKKFVNLINIALDECLSEDPGVMLFGLGVSDMSSFLALLSICNQSMD